MEVSRLVRAAKRSTEEQLAQQAEEAPEGERMPAQELMRLERVVVSLVAGGALRDRIEGDLMLLQAREDGESVSFLLVGQWTYPLVNQPVMWCSPGEYILPGETGAAVLRVDQERTSPESIAEFDARLAAFCQLRDRATGTIMQPELSASDGGMNIGVRRDEAATALVDRGEDDGAGAPGVHRVTEVGEGEGEEGEEEEEEETNQRWDRVAAGVGTLGRWTAAGIAVGASYTGAAIGQCVAFHSTPTPAARRP